MRNTSSLMTIVDAILKYIRGTLEAYDSVAALEGWNRNIGNH